jgi:starvation-inducible DNA-binding protein
MVSTLANDQEKIVATAQKALELAQESGDEVTADVMIGRIETHQKNKWMLDAHLTN